MNEGLVGLFGAAKSGVKSVQYGTVNINNPSTSGTATINPVNPAKAVLIPLGTRTSDNSFQQCSVALSLTNSTTVTGQVNLAPSGGGNVTNFVVVEFY